MAQQHLKWREQYHSRRYMEFLDEEGLRQRAKDIFANLLELTKESKIGLLTSPFERNMWLRIWTHVLEEFKIRYGDYPAGFKGGWFRDVHYPNPKLPLAKSAAYAVKCTGLPPGDHLFKYGKACHLEGVINDGFLRVAPASFYDDPSLGFAIRDSEMRANISLYPRDFKIKAFDGKTRKFKGEIPASEINCEWVAPTNYFVSCFSLSLLPRLFIDFEADSCLIINNTDAFASALDKGTHDQLSGWTFHYGLVEYYDPLNYPLPQLDVYMSKNFRYAYQREFRFLWLPESPMQTLDPIFVNIPCIKENCYLLKI
ncbi:MAG: hypothetical protein GYA46_11810 [candidate division Zixibacteria bacterium]|nr:hypothetical protein [candidate division Zixibacteria bacterium]